ncbi:MAG: hypothetical protein ACYS80_09225 [Planctomycetota bacterium]|jgi:hypothetical protein
MKKFLIGFLLLACALVLIFLLLQRPKTQQPQTTEIEVVQEAMDFPEPPPGAIVFDMKYRSLSGGKDELRYNSYWGFGNSGEDNTAFIQNLKKNIKEFETVNNRYFKGAEWAGLEMKDNKAVALYFDLNANGKVSDNEKILPINREETASRRRAEFITPDFILNTRDGQKVPFRTLLKVSFYGQASRPNCMWSPSCVLEGMSTIDEEPAKLILFTSGFSGSFNEFGECSYSLLTPKEETGQYISRHTLSSIINYKGPFYNLKLYGSHEQGKRVRAVLEKYTGATGELAVKLTGNTNLKAKLSRASIVGSKDNTIRFNVPSDQAKLPTGAFKLNNSYMYYGAEKDDEWQLDFKEGPEFTLDADKTNNVEVGKPILSIKAIDEKKRYSNDVKEQTVYTKGTDIHISRIVKGKAGELYGRFSQRQDDSRRYTDIQPDIRIVDSEGKEVAAAKIKYG